MHKLLSFILLMCAILVSGCIRAIDGYMPASAISQNGFARSDAAVRALTGQTVQIWGYVDHGNLYGDDAAQVILGDWWGGPGPDADTWRFDLKAGADAATGQSFAVHVTNDEGRDVLLARFAKDAAAQTPTRAFVTGRLITFDAPLNAMTRTGLRLEVQSSSDVLLGAD